MDLGELPELDAVLKAVYEYFCLGIDIYQFAVIEGFTVPGFGLGDEDLPGLAMSSPRAVSLALPAATLLAQVVIGIYLYFFGGIVPQAMKNYRCARRVPEGLDVMELLAKFRLGFCDESLGVLNTADDFSP